MNVFFELSLIIFISFIGVGISTIFKLPIPGSVMGMMIFYLLMEVKVIKTDRIGCVCDFLNGHMALFFIPLNVGLLASYKLFASKAVGLVITVIVSTFVGIFFSYVGVVAISKLLGKEGKDSGTV